MLDYWMKLLERRRPPPQLWLSGIVVYVLIAIFVYNGCASSTRFTAKKTTPTAKNTTAPEGYASYYADEFHGRQTANGEMYDMHAMTAAHRTLPFGTIVRVKNTTNGKSVVVRINDRGPFKDERIIDVSLGAAKQIGLIGPGTAWVELEILELGAQSP